MVALDLWPDLRDDAICYEDADLIAVVKPAGVPSQAAEPEHDDDVVARLKRHLAARRGTDPDDVYLGVHQRLDRDTSGLMVFALRREANPGLARQFEGRTVEKTYVAAVHGMERETGERVLRDRLARGKDGRMQVVARGARGQDAVTRVRVRERRGARALVELACDTGRTHQLRVQLAHVGTPIAGDRLYGGKEALRLLLHAEKLRLAHPMTGAELELTAPPPLELARWLEHGATNVLDDPELLRRALVLAIEARYRLGRARGAPQPTTAFRLLHGAAEGAPGLSVDVYGDHLVAHFAADVGERCERAVLDALEALGPAGVYVKRHPRQKNELGEARDTAWAPSRPLRGRAAPDELVVYEHGVPFGVRLGDGLRTGLFLDQRDNRRRVHALARGLRVLNLFAYTGGFSVAALAGGAEEAICVDASAAALEWARRNTARIGAADRHRTLHEDAFSALARFARRGERFDLIVVDPPSYATTRARRFVVLEDYAELCAAALRVLAPGGTLLACVNHHRMTRARLRRELAHAARAAGRTIARMKDLPAPLDHPAPFGGEPQSKSVLLTCDAIRDSVPGSPTQSAASSGHQPRLTPRGRAPRRGLR